MGDSVFAARAGKFKNGNLGVFTGSHKIAVKSVTKVSVDDEHFSYIYILNLTSGVGGYWGYFLHCFRDTTKAWSWATE